ncbi:MAG: ABC transporter ATP-binding protein, partial [bacterium]|nr:ABC transporter ATP-binding protein [bacterium]
GKTTTIRTILDYIRPTAGKIKVLGMDPQLQGAEVRRKVGYLPSDFTMSSRMTAGEYLYFLLGMMDHTGNNRIEELSERFNLDLTKRIKDFSRGNRQKVGLVSAFMHSPKLMIMDEPSTGLDPLMQQEFYKLLLEEKKKGNTIFLSSHILSEVDAICDRVAVIREGELVAVETMGEFKKKTGRLMIIDFRDAINPEIFQRIKGVSDVKSEGNRLVLTVFSNVDGIIKLLAKHTVDELTFEDTSLEHVFLKYYGMEEVQRENSGAGVNK